MKLKKTILLSFLLIHMSGYCQNYIVSVEDRNKAIDLTNKAVESIKEKKVEDAVSSLSMAISIDSTFRPAYLRLYEACMKDNSHFDVLISNLKKAKRLFWDDDELCFYLGEVYRKKNDLSNAILEYSAAVSKVSQKEERSNLVPNYYFNRGVCYLKQEMIDAALLDFNSAIELKPDYTYALLNRGICAMKKGRKDEACSDWGKAFELGFSLAKEYMDRYCKK